MKPSVRVIKQLNPKHAELAKALAKSIRTQVDTLDKRGAWPDECGKFEIIIVNSAPPPEIPQPTITKVEAPSPSSGDATGSETSKPVIDPRTYAKGMEVRWQLDENAPLSKIRRDPATMMQLAISVELMTVECGCALVNLGADEEDVIFHLLAHEIHHLNEAERLIECQFERGDHLNNLAKAVRKELPEEWIEAVKHFSKHHGLSKRIQLDDLLVTAGHIADEACADMTGLHWLDADGRDWKAYSQYLIDFRAEEAVASRKKHSRVDQYEVAPAIEALCNSAVRQTLPEIQARTMQMAIDMAMASPCLYAETRKLFSQLGSCPTIASRPKTIKKKSFLGRITGR